MQVGWLGLGKLGLPCALTLAHDAEVSIAGYDPNPDIEDVLKGDLSLRNHEDGLAELISDTFHRIALADSVAQVVADTDGIVFCAVQTPHDAAYGGEQPMPEITRDFDYAALRTAAEAVAAAALDQQKQITLVVISTALPGTMRTQILPVLNEWVTLVYNPFFIAMGTTIRDFRNPEMVLLGNDGLSGAPTPLIQLYGQMYDDAHGLIREMSWESAELTKVSYNTFISMKITFVNTLLEICDATGADVDDVTDALKQATDRVVSPAYLSAGMGDGGACHPRDNIAMSWLAKAHGLSADPFEFVTRAREQQTLWLARRVVHEAGNRGLPVILLGKAYKPSSDLQYGSPALLLAHYLTELGLEYEHRDHYCGDDENDLEPGPKLYVITTRHPDYGEGLNVEDGSAILDPFRYVEDQPEVEVIRLGAGWRDEEEA